MIAIEVIRTNTPFLFRDKSRESQVSFHGVPTENVADQWQHVLLCQTTSSGAIKCSLGLDAGIDAVANSLEKAAQHSQHF